MICYVSLLRLPRLLGLELGVKLYIHDEKRIHCKLDKFTTQSESLQISRKENTYILMPGLPKHTYISGITNLAKFLNST